MAKYYFTKLALIDLRNIWDYTVTEWSKSQAEKYYNLIMASCADLANNTQLGKSYEIVTREVLGYKCGQHIIFYRIISDKEIEVARVLHVAMDLKTKI